MLGRKKYDINLYRSFRGLLSNWRDADRIVVFFQINGFRNLKFGGNIHRQKSKIFMIMLLQEFLNEW